MVVGDAALEHLHDLRVRLEGAQVGHEALQVRPVHDLEHPAAGAHGLGVEAEEIERGHRVRAEDAMLARHAEDDTGQHLRRRERLRNGSASGVGVGLELGVEGRGRGRGRARV